MLLTLWFRSFLEVVFEYVFGSNFYNVENVLITRLVLSNRLEMAVLVLEERIDFESAGIKELGRESGGINVGLLS